MNLSEITTLIAVLLFGILAITMSIQEERIRKTSHKRIKELEDTLKAKEDATQMVVHELKAPLTAIKDAAALLMQSVNPMNKEEEMKLLALTHDQAKKLLDQVSGILDTAKLQAGKFTIDKIHGDLKSIIQKQIEIFIPAALTKKITLSFPSQKVLPPVSFDPLRISQVITNLISNSIKFTPEGGEIDLAAKEQTIEGKKSIVVSVRDNGLGIPKEKQTELFSKYSKTSNPTISPITATTPISYGTGLGLYIVKGIIEAHNGAVTVDSEPGKGTTISFSLPLS